jgi:hypothetical protein
MAPISGANAVTGVRLGSVGKPVGVVTPKYCNDTVMRMLPDMDTAMDRQRMRETGRRLADGYLKDPPLSALKSNCELAAGRRLIAEE